MLSLLPIGKSLNLRTLIPCVWVFKNKNSCMRYKAKLPERQPEWGNPYSAYERDWNVCHSMLVTFRSYGIKWYSWKGNHKTVGKWRKSVPTTRNANSIDTNWGWPKPGNGHGHTALIVVWHVNDLHMAKESSLFTNTKRKDGARGIEKSNRSIK